MNFKTCKLCKKNLSIDSFWKNPSIKDGYFNKCKICAAKIRNINVLKEQKYLNDNLWTCSTCNITLPLTIENFHKRNDSSTGFQHRCKKCVMKDPLRYNRYSDSENLQLYIKDILNGIKSRSRTKNLKFELTVEFLIDMFNNQNGECAISKEKMTYIRSKGRIQTNISVDKINPSLGYTKDNVQLLCVIINIMKSNLSMSELKHFCNLILKHND